MRRGPNQTEPMGILPNGVDRTEITCPLGEALPTTTVKETSTDATTLNLIATEETTTAPGGLSPPSDPTIDPMLAAFNRKPRPPAPKPTDASSSGGGDFVAHYRAPRQVEGVDARTVSIPGIFVQSGDPTHPGDVSSAKDSPANVSAKAASPSPVEDSPANIPPAAVSPVTASPVNVSPSKASLVKDSPGNIVHARVSPAKGEDVDTVRRPVPREDLQKDELQTTFVSRPIRRKIRAAFTRNPLQAAVLGLVVVVIPLVWFAGGSSEVGVLSRSRLTAAERIPTDPKAVSSASPTISQPALPHPTAVAQTPKTARPEMATSPSLPSTTRPSSRPKTISSATAARVDMKVEPE